MTPEEVDSIDTAPHGPTVDLMIKEIRRGWARERELLERNNITLEEKRTAERAQVKHTKWEYRFEQYPAFKELGIEGWELAGVEKYIHIDTSPRLMPSYEATRYIFKRPKVETENA